MPCIDGETLAAWSAGALRPAQAADVEAHIADCARCQAMLALFVRTEPVAPPHQAWWQRWQVRWLVPLATAATVAAIWVAAPGPDVTDRAPIEPQMSAPPATPSTPAAPSATAPSTFETRQTAPSPPPGVGSTAGARQSVDSLRKLEQPRDPQANVPTARDERLAAVPPPAAAPAPQASPPAAAAAPPVAAEPAPKRLQETVAVTAESAVAQERSAFVEIMSPDQAIRWRIVAGRQVERSTNSGGTWDRVTIPGGLLLTAGHSPAPNVAWLVGAGGGVLVTSDGSRFERVPFPETAALLSVVAIDARQATVTTVDGRTFATADGGRTWRQR